MCLLKLSNETFHQVDSCLGRKVDGIFFDTLYIMALVKFENKKIIIPYGLYLELQREINFFKEKAV